MLEDIIKEKAISIGFDLIGISKIDNRKDYNHYKAWLNKGFNGKMLYMANNKEKRNGVLMPFAKNVISLGLNYYSSPNKNQDANISIYAKGIDYHKVLTKMIKRLASFIKVKYPYASLRYAVDTAPILEKAYAQQAGIGWIGKNTCLINNKLGSFIFLGELITDIPLKLDNEAINYCGTCMKCIDACPSKAIVAPYTLDSRLCISYLNIELKDDIQKELLPKITNNIFGCDICQEVCPWNKDAVKTEIISLIPNREIENKTLKDCLSLNEESFKLLFKQSPIKRLKFRYFLRNAIIVAGNSLKYKYKEQLEILNNKLNDSFLQSYIDFALNNILQSNKKKHTQKDK